MLTISMIIITSIISIIAFQSREVMAKLQFNPYQVYHQKEYYRLFTHGFVHADWMHLIINMYVLYSFGRVIENIFSDLQYAGMIKSVGLYYILLYVGGLLFSPLLTLFKHKDNNNYNSVGASGAVSAIVFCFIFFAPVQRLQLFFILPLPGIFFAVAYLIYSSIMGKRARDNINHDAHLIGAVFGFLFPLVINVRLIFHFINELQSIF